MAVAARTAAKTALAMPARRPSPFPFAGRPRSSEPPRGLDVEIKLIVLVPLLRFVRPDVVVSITGVARILSREPLACVDPARKPLASVDSARDPLVYNTPFWIAASIRGMASTRTMRMRLEMLVPYRLATSLLAKSASSADSSTP